MGVAAVLTHSWEVDTHEARQLQEQLRSRVRIEPLASPVESVAGVDVSVKGGAARAAVVLFSFPGLDPLEAATYEIDVAFPYVPGLLAFREGPAVLGALEQLERRPELLMFDAQGLAHPRRMGLATHLGVLCDLPSVGCAKSRLCGEHDDLALERGSWVPLKDGEEIVGAVLRTRDGVRPVYVSVGHHIDLAGALEMVMHCCTRYRLPEPTRWAHRVAGGHVLELPTHTSA
jgi:deoxyribonuclease V